MGRLLQIRPNGPHRLRVTGGVGIAPWLMFQRLVVHIFMTIGLGP